MHTFYWFDDPSKLEGFHIKTRLVNTTTDGLRQDWRTFLTARAPNFYKFRKNFFRVRVGSLKIKIRFWSLP